MSDRNEGKDTKKERQKANKNDKRTEKRDTKER